MYGVRVWWGFWSIARVTWQIIDRIRRSGANDMITQSWTISLFAFGVGHLGLWFEPAGYVLRYAR